MTEHLKTQLINKLQDQSAIIGPGYVGPPLALRYAEAEADNTVLGSDLPRLVAAECEAAILAAIPA